MKKLPTNKKIRVLIAEDDYLVGKNIKRALESLGYEIAGEAKDGEHAAAMCPCVEWTAAAPARTSCAEA